MTNGETSPVWLVTGASSGFGRAIVRAAAADGARVIATARRAERIDARPGVSPVQLDVTDRAAVERVVSEAVAAHGRLDVVVNNAGYGLLAAAEEATDDQIRRVFDTNLFGAIAVTRAVLPQMRLQQAGRLFQMSSVGAQVANAGFGYYQAAKCALEGFSAALADEVRPFGITVTIVEPGDFRTSFLTAIDHAEVHPAYSASLRSAREKPRELHGTEPGDPALAAETLVRLSKRPDTPLRLPLGADALARIHRELAGRQADLERWEETILGTSHP